MADDWAKNFVENYNQEQLGKQQKEQEAQKRRGYAEAGAETKFHQIRERVGQDIKTLSGAVAFQSVELQDLSEKEFKVSYRGQVRVELEVSLHLTTITYTYVFFPQGGAKDAKREPKTLRICSDLDGVITVSENGEGKTFVYDSEISEFLLKRLITHIISQ